MCLQVGSRGVAANYLTLTRRQTREIVLESGVASLDLVGAIARVDRSVGVRSSVEGLATGSRFAVLAIASSASFGCAMVAHSSLRIGLRVGRQVPIANCNTLSFGAALSRRPAAPNKVIPPIPYAGQLPHAAER